MAVQRLTRAERQAQTRRALLDAAAEVFVARGFQGASVEAICEAAGFTRGAFYSNFSAKEELFAELLQDRIYSLYREMTEAQLDEDTPLMSPRQAGEALAAMQGLPEGRWLFRLWLELLAHAGREESFRDIAAGFWRANRELLAQVTERAYAEGRPGPRADPRVMASALIALDIGLALQHFVDPEGVPLDVYPQVFEALLAPAPSA